MQIMAAARKYSEEFRQHAVRMVLKIRQEAGDQAEAINRVADELSVHPETLQQWVEQAQADEARKSFDATTIAEPDPYEAGVQLVEFGALDEAQTGWGAAAEAGNTDAADNLGVLLGQQRSRAGS
jgi:transposase-like protein